MPGPAPLLYVFMLLMVQTLSFLFDDSAIGMCERGHVKVDGSCFTFGPKNTNWNDANTICLASDMDLARINTQEKHDALNEYMSEEFSYFESFWIDLRRTAIGFVHVSDQRKLNQSFWNPGEPNNKNEKCVFKNAFGWGDAQCSWKISFICESQECPSGCEGDAKVHVSVPSDNNVNVVHCQNGAKKLGDICYFIESSRSTTWDDARADCLQNSSKLALMNTDEKYKQLDAYLKTLPQINWKPFWIAPRRAVGTDDFYDGRNEVTGTRWAKGEPNNSGGSEDCVLNIYRPQATEFKWNDATCHSKAGFICELKAPAQIDQTIEKTGRTSSEANVTTGSPGNSNSEIVKETTDIAPLSSFPTSTIETPVDSAGSSAKALFSMVATLTMMACMKL